MIEIKHLKKSYGEVRVYDDFSLAVEENKVTAILGESGCGKTTLLNILAGLTPFESGEITGEIMPVSFIFQSDRLLKNLTVEENLRFVCEGDFTDDLRRAGLFEVKDRYIKDLSGGQRRRAAILRAFVFPSKTVLMDEPFLNIDLKLKRQLMDFYLSVYEGHRRTALFVTHDVDEALYLADRIVVLKNGTVAADFTDVKNTSREMLIQTLIS